MEYLWGVASVLLVQNIILIFLTDRLRRKIDDKNNP